VKAKNGWFTEPILGQGRSTTFRAFLGLLSNFGVKKLTEIHGMAHRPLPGL